MISTRVELTKQTQIHHRVVVTGADKVLRWGANWVKRDKYVVKEGKETLVGKHTVALLNYNVIHIKCI